MLCVNFPFALFQTLTSLSSLRSVVRVFHLLFPSLDVVCLYVCKLTNEYLVEKE